MLLVMKIANEIDRAKETMKTLISKFPDGYEGWARGKGEEPVKRPKSYTTVAPNI